MKERFLAWSRRHEGLITVLLVLLAVVILCVAFFGKSHHKAILMIYLAV